WVTTTPAHGRRAGGYSVGVGWKDWSLWRSTRLRCLGQQRRSSADSTFPVCGSQIWGVRCWGENGEGRKEWCYTQECWKQHSALNRTDPVNWPVLFGFGRLGYLARDRVE